MLIHVFFSSKYLHYVPSYGIITPAENNTNWQRSMYELENSIRRSSQLKNIGQINIAKHNTKLIKRNQYIHRDQEADRVVDWPMSKSSPVQFPRGMDLNWLSAKIDWRAKRVGYKRMWKTFTIKWVIFIRYFQTNLNQIVNYCDVTEDGMDHCNRSR